MPDMENNGIYGFFNEYRFLSNFWYSQLYIDMKSYDSVEHYFQACKASNENDHELIRHAKTSSEAKKLGKTIDIREDWDMIKSSVMLKGLMAKFSQHQDLAKKLIATGDAYLEETNWWGDTYWGVCNNQGKNVLGRLLMLVRDIVG